jgi:hypothetical protein
VDRRVCKGTSGGRTNVESVVEGADGNLEVSGGGKKGEMRNEVGGGKGKGIRGSVGGKGEDSDANEYEFDEWPVTASFNEAVDNAVEKVLVASPVKSGKTEGKEGSKRTGVEGREENVAGRGESQKRGWEEESSDCKRCKFVWNHLRRADFRIRRTSSTPG